VSDYSLNESAYRAKLAVRGVGYSWGLAEDAGRALYWLSERGLDGFTALVSVISDIDSNLLGAPRELSGKWNCEHAGLCPLITGMCVSDCASRLCASRLTDRQTIHISDIAYPVLTLPFMADAALAYNCELMFNSTEFKAVVGSNALLLHGDSNVVLTSEASFACGNNANEFSDLSFVSITQREPRVNIDAAVWHKLGEYAHRTYAPATDQSRMLGAGAGIVDSD